MTEAGSAAFPDARGAVVLDRMVRRTDYLRTAKGRVVRMPGFVLQARPQDGGVARPARVGFTCSKKVGNAVARNRAKRRLREIARLQLPHSGRSGWDYVLIGRREVTGRRDFATMRAELETALERIHR